MGKLIYRLLDEAYNRAVIFYNRFNDFMEETFGGLVEFLWNGTKRTAAFLFAVVIYGTLPVWVIPYKLVKINKERRSNE